MNARECKARLATRSAILRASVAPLSATVFALFVLAGAQAATEPNFHDYLEQGYREVATYAVTRAGDADLGKHFTDKARLAATEQAVAPDLPTPMALPQNIRAEMMAARNSLTNALAAGAQETDPLTTAVAQVNLDCWLAQFKGSSQSGSEDCRRLFYLAIAKLPTTTTLAVLTEEEMIAGGAELNAAASGMSISAVGDTSSSTSPVGPVGGTIAAVAGPLQNLGAALDQTLASTNSTASSTVGGITDPAANTAGGVLGSTSDSAGGALGQVGDAVGGTLGGVGGAVGGALGGAGGAVGGALGGAGDAAGSGGLGGGGGLGGLGGGGGGLGGLGGGGGGLGGLGGGGGGLGGLGGGGGGLGGLGGGGGGLL